MATTFGIGYDVWNHRERLMGRVTRVNLMDESVLVELESDPTTSVTWDMQDIAVRVLRGSSMPAPASSCKSAVSNARSRHRMHAQFDTDVGEDAATDSHSTLLPAPHAPVDLPSGELKTTAESHAATSSTASASSAATLHESHQPPTPHEPAPPRIHEDPTLHAMWTKKRKTKAQIAVEAEYTDAVIASAHARSEFTRQLMHLTELYLTEYRHQYAQDKTGGSGIDLLGVARRGNMQFQEMRGMQPSSEVKELAHKCLVVALDAATRGAVNHVADIIKDARHTLSLFYARHAKGAQK